jgi:hypothetical protein
MCFPNTPFYQYIYMKKKQTLYINYILIICLLIVIIYSLAKKNADAFSLRSNYVIDPSSNSFACIGIINDASRNKLKMRTCGNYGSQRWSLNNGQLTNQYSYNSRNGNKPYCIDIIKNRADNKVTMNECSDDLGQQWTISNGQLTNKLSKDSGGNPSCLDMDASGNNLFMTRCAIAGSSSSMSKRPGQQWSII